MPRPYELANLFVDGAAYDQWQAFNWNVRRFFVVNARTVMGELRIQHTNMARHFESAHHLIQDETTWNRQFRGEYRASKTQLYPKSLAEPKLLDKALVCIVALELAAAEADRQFDVYEYLRILPAFYFIDLLDKQMIETLERRQGPAEPFRAAVVRGAGQRQERLLDEMANGYCVTGEVAERLLQGLNELDLPFAVGPVRAAGDPRSSSNFLGSRHAAPSLDVALNRPRDELERS